MGKGLIILIMGSVMMMAVVSMTLQKSATSGIDNAYTYYEDIQARNVGNSMVNMLLTRMADSLYYRLNDPQTKRFSGGEVEFRVVDSALVVGDTVSMIEVNVVINKTTKTMAVFSRPAVVDGWVPPVVRGAWTANGDLNNTISDMYIDGRDHDMNLAIVPFTGTQGVSSSVAFNNTANAAIGGTKDSVDYALTYPESPDVIEENYDWGGTFPDTPDEILGYPEGTLKALAQTGVDGSQYLLNPAAKIEVKLKFPLSGITYIEITDGVERQLTMEGYGNKGVLIVHGPGNQARLKGLKIDLGLKKPKVKDGDPVIFCHDPGGPNEETMSGDPAKPSDSLAAHMAHGDMVDECPDPNSGAWFEGLIVTDYSFHHHLDILGAMLQLSTDLEMDKACNGNAEHWVKYSSEAIEIATEFTAINTGEIGNSSGLNFMGTGYGQGRQKAFAWFE